MENKAEEIANDFRYKNGKPDVGISKRYGICVYTPEEVNRLLVLFASQQKPEISDLQKEVERLREVKVRPQLLWFSEIMETKLKKNDNKGGWDNCEIDWLISRLKEEVKEIEDAWLIKKNDFGRSAGEGFLLCPSSEDIQNECADVANFAMMIADKTKLYIFDKIKFDDRNKLHIRETID